MGKFLYLDLRRKGIELSDGLLITLTVQEDGSSGYGKTLGTLSCPPKLLENYRQWREIYVKQDIALRGRFAGVEPCFTERVEDIQKVSQTLVQSLNEWLDTSDRGFLPVRDKLIALAHSASQEEDVRLVIQSEVEELYRLPWHLWRPFENACGLEIAVSPINSDFAKTQRNAPQRKKIRILAVLGSKQGIKLRDKAILKKIPQDQAEVVYLVQPTARSLYRALRDKRGWDLFFFAGHSATYGEKGVIHINKSEKLTISDLRNALRFCVEKGLRLAIFNSCDGLGLAWDLAELNIPHCICMKEPIPDGVAYQFFEHFLESFVGIGKKSSSLYGAIRQARDSLQDYELEYPCASWLPVVCQNPVEPPLSWQKLKNLSVLQGEANSTLQTIASSPSWWLEDLRPLNFSAFLIDKGQYFVGREWVFEEIEKRCVQGEQAILLTGDPGAGKSAIIAELIRRNPGGGILAYHCCQSDVEHSLRPGRFVRSLAAQIASRMETYAECLLDPLVKEALSESNCETDPANALESGVINPLLSLSPPGQKKYITIDGLDESLRAMGSKSIVHVLSSRLHRFPPWLHIIISARREPEILLRMSRVGISEIAADDHRNIADIDQYLDSRIAEPRLSQALKLSDKNAVEVKQRLLQKGKGNFLYVQQALEAIERKLYSFDSLEELPPGLSGMYLNFFEQNFPSVESFEPLQRLLEIMVAAQEPLRVEQLALAAGLSLDEVLYQILNKLSVWLPLHKDQNGQDRYAFYHQSLADWLVSPSARGTPYYISELRGHQHLAEACLTIWEKDLYAPIWKNYVEQYAPLHLLLADYSDRFIPVLLKSPKRIKTATVDTISKVILDKQGNIDAKVDKFLRALAVQQDWIATNTLMSIAYNLLDYSQGHACQKVIEKLPNAHPHVEIIKIALELRASFLGSRTEQVIKLSQQLLRQPRLPQDLKALAQFHLAEGLRVSGRFLQAMNAYKEAVGILCPQADFMSWMQANCALGDLEYVYGRLDDAHARLAILLEKAEARRSVIFCAALRRLSGRLCQIVGDYASAKENFEESLSLFRKARRPINIVESLNSLAQAEIYLEPDRARELLKESRALAEKYEANLEIGKSFWIEAELQFHSGEYVETLKLALEAERKLSSVSYEAGVAKVRTLMAQACLRLSDYEKAIQSALAAHQFLIKEQIYPSYRLQAYHALMEAALPMGERKFYQGLDSPTQIPFIDNYPNMRMLLDLYRKGGPIGG
jgi:tetratricopeptide (TPR) repeat protein